MLNKSKKNLYILAYILSFLAVLSFLLWKCQYGFANIDESFYLTIPYRLCLGDSLILHEWHLSQLSSVLLFPVMKSYLFVFGNTERIILNFRIIFTLTWAAGAMFFFYRLKKLSPLGAAVASIVFLLYTPFCIMALSYNSMGILSLLLACVIFATAEKSRYIQYCFAGIFFAGAVLCCPYLLLLYVLFALVALCMFLLHKSELFLCWLAFSAGCAVLFLVFCITLLSKASLAQLIDALPLLFKDPEHEHISLIRKTYLYLHSIMHSCSLFPLCLAAAVIITVYSVVRKQPCSGMIIICLFSLLLQINYLIETPYINFVMFPINLIGPYCVLHTKKSSVRMPFITIWLPGLIYTYCIHLSSNQNFYAISSASTVMTVASVIILVCFVRNLDWTKLNARLYKAAQIVATLLLAVQVCAEISLRYTTVFWEPQGMAAQTVQAESGPECGILMTQSRYQHYRSSQRDVEVIRSREKIKKILFLSVDTYLYLCAEKEMATYSAWLSGINDISMQRLDTYFNLIPEKSPDGIYIDPEYPQYVDVFVNRGYNLEILDSGAYLLTLGP